MKTLIKMSKLHNPYGDGLASKRIVDFIKNIEIMNPEVVTIG